MMKKTRRHKVQEMNISRKFLTYTLINLLWFVLVYAIMAIVILLIFSSTYDKSANRVIRDYANKVVDYDVIEIVNFCDPNKSVYYEEMIHPGIKVAVYKRRDDGTLDLISRDKFIQKTLPKLNKNEGNIIKEVIGENVFKTYTISINQLYGGKEIYVKMFYDFSIGEESTKILTSDLTILAIIFMAISILTSLFLSLIQIRPVLKTLKSQKDLVNEISHEFRTPLSIIKGNLENILASPESSVTNVLESIDISLSQVDRLSKMSNELLSLARDIKDEDVANNGNVSEIVRNIAENYSELVMIENKSLMVSVDEVYADIDKDKITQLVGILLENANKYTNPGDSIKIKLRKNKYNFTLTVSDSGRGVPDAELPNIFNKFYRAENTSDKQGTGLGLAIAKSIVEKHEGVISAKNNYPKGFSVMATMPFSLK